MSPPPLTIVWYKRDLRIDDHAALADAARRGPVLPLYVVEPEYWSLPDTSARHWSFFRGAVADLADQLNDMGGSLVVRVGEMPDVLDRLWDEVGPFALTAHMETGNAWTYARDETVRAWCRDRSVPFTEHQQFGVWRGKTSVRKNWAKRWDALMATPQIDLPPRIEFVSAASQPLPTSKELGLPDDGLLTLQPSGRSAALETLHSFLNDRGEPYRKAMSTPIEGATACSRLSVHLMAGSLSMREIYQATLARQEEVAQLPAKSRGTWVGSLSSFVGRLHWHCHFMQKLEDEPELEWRPMARSYEGLRPDGAGSDRLAAFEAGQTGYPFVDACLRSLRAKGWINFRMRAMLMSFASYNLWLPWQQSGEVLARLFTDYEPGIHWPQSQMQAGETGINAVRIYSPVKQGHDQDPDGVFTRKWVPELAHLSGGELQAPWEHGVKTGAYPPPIVDYTSTVKAAKSAIYGHRRTPEAKAEAADVFERHGSRKPRHLRQRPKRRANDAA